MPKVQIRTARATDRADVEAICAQIWEKSDDYVPRVWDDWLADPDGRLIVAESGDHVVGLAKLTHLTGDQWWLEGLRVSPEHQRRGIAGKLHTHLVDRFRQKEDGAVRFATHSENHPVHRLASRDGFRHVAAYRLYETTPLPPERVPPLRRLTEGSLGRAWALIEGSPRHQVASGLYETFWAWELLTPERLAHHLSEGDVWGLDEDGDLAAVALICRTDKEDAVDLGYVDGRTDALEGILLGLRGLAARREAEEMRFRAVVEPELIHAVEEAGYEPGWDRDLWVFELS